LSAYCRGGSWARPREATIDRDFHKEFAAPAGTVLHLEHGDGAVEIVPWDRDVVDVTVRYHAEVTRVGFGKDIAFDVDFRQTGKTISVAGRERGGTTIGILYRNVSEYAFRIQAPPTVALELEGEDGDVTVVGWKADIACSLDDGSLRIDGAQARRIHLETEDGDITLAGLAGDLDIEGDDGRIEVSDSALGLVRIDVEDGDIAIADCRGDFEIEGDDGDVRAQRVHAGRLRVRTEDGDVDLDLAAAEAVEVMVADGRVRVGLAEGMSMAFSIRTGDGTVTVDLPGVGKLHEGDHEVTGEWNGGRGRLDVSAEDGDVLLRAVRP
jgi:DUF4097 and DUF4098 domain-containing protein YvlB